MCDTMVALGNSTKDGSVIFAKNSDRQPNEPHIIIKIPRRYHKSGEKVKCTYIEIEQVETTYEVLLLKPSWIWGCEMGCNEFGLNIGNEAVFTKEKYGRDSLIGMDMVRIALERSKTSEQALGIITGLLEKYGQGGNCGYDKNFTYHNSFLIADKESAWVLETSGKYWAAEKVRDVRNISNCLSIDNKMDKYHPDLIKHATDKGWCKNEKDFSFSRCYTDPLITKFSGANERFATIRDKLENDKGDITIDTMKSLLRAHHKSLKKSPFTKHSIKSVCMHGGFIYGDHTTGSYIASLNKNNETYWLTGSSTPCISVFKPFWLLDGEKLTFSEKNRDNAIKFWHEREIFHREIIKGKITNLETYLKERDELEKELTNMVDSLDLNNNYNTKNISKTSSNNDKLLTANEKKLIEIIDYALKQEKALILKMMEESKNNPVNMKGNFYFKHYWNKNNKKLM